MISLRGRTAAWVSAHCRSTSACMVSRIPAWWQRTEGGHFPAGLSFSPGLSMPRPYL